MEDADQVQAYSATGESGGLLSASYVYHTEQITRVIQGANSVIDLGCGSGRQLCQIAAVNPNCSFLGIDLSSNMLASARQYSEKIGLKNISFLHGDITDLGAIPSGSADAVISTLALHHLPSRAHLNKCFGEASRVLRANGRIYIADFGRLKSLKSVLYLAYMDAADQPHIVSLDYERSLRAAFTLEDFREAYLLVSAHGAGLFSTFKVPFLVVIKTPSLPLSAMHAAHISQLQAGLSPKYRRVIRLLNTLFFMGGMR